ncbi:unnamed protein product [marine sediment metagenome]|uniref:Uncharacterized protein n=1 Tax=marine sediment metagenome TaxID=412755 RepID=X1U0I6_9ZZZZ
MENKLKKCHNCKGEGIVKCNTIASKCYYCRGKGYRITIYGIDNRDDLDEGLLEGI